MKRIFLLSLIILFTACSHSPVVDSGEIDFLTGTWQVEGQQAFEVWEKNTADYYSGYSYRIKEGEKIVWEQMQLLLMDDNHVLRITVPDQNDGQAIDFALVSSAENIFRFENPEHDFPKKITYQKITNTEYFVDVRGDVNKGFRIKLVKISDREK